jgi:hypothetical protein
MTELKPGLCVLFTNAFISNWTGSELYIRDVAVELIKRGHKPIVYSPQIGELTEQLRSKSIPVVTDLNSIRVKPDIIHGQHHLETMTALAHFPGTPAVFFCHGWLPWEETPLIHPRILQYVVVSQALNDRLVYECGIPAEKVTTILNSVDLDKFRPRPNLPARPKRALLFNSRSNEADLLSIVRQACTQNDILVDAMGYGSGNSTSHPETELPKYDVVFAVGRSALESLAIGAAVICCGVDGAGQMVCMHNLELLRSNNFGIRILNRPLTADVLSTELHSYDPLDALKVSQVVRASAGLGEMVDKIIELYASTLNGWAKDPPPDPTAENLALAVFLQGLSGKLQTANLANQQALALHDELDLIKSSSTWKLYERLTRNSVIQKIYMTLTGSFRRRK